MDADFSIIDFDLIDDGADVCAPERDFAMADVLAHHAREGGDFFIRDFDFGAQFGGGTVKGDLGDVAFGRQRAHALFERRVGRVRNAVLDRLIKAAQFSLRLKQLFAQCGQAVRAIRVFGRLPFQKPEEQLADPLRDQKLFGEPVGHRLIELVHWHRPA